MVLMTLTPGLVEAIELYAKHTTAKDDQMLSDLLDPREGNPISHEQIIHLSRWLSSENARSPNVTSKIPRRLNNLLKGCRIYSPPKARPQKQTSEYQRLMARLRREEEARSYERMVNPQAASESFSQRFPGSRYNTIFQVQSNKAEQEDEMTFAEVKRQATLIINVLVSIICTAVFLWIAARRWSVEARLALSMIGALIVAIAEVVIFSGYLRRLKEAKQMERKKVEVKTVEDTWVIEGISRAGTNKDGLRLRQAGIKLDVHERI